MMSVWQVGAGLGNFVGDGGEGSSIKVFSLFFFLRCYLCLKKDMIVFYVNWVGQILRYNFRMNGYISVEALNRVV